ncbi:TPA: hemagglutinin repeat-containing protein [Neisseria subflava]
MAAANAGWQAYQTGKGAQNLANGTTNAKQVSISITYGEQQNQQTTQVQANQAQASQIQAGGKTTLIAGGAGEQSNINITGSDVSGKVCWVSQPNLLNLRFYPLPNPLPRGEGTAYRKSDNS